MKPTLWFRTVHDVESQKFVSIDHDLWSYKKSIMLAGDQFSISPNSPLLLTRCVEQDIHLKKERASSDKEVVCQNVKYVLDSYGRNNLDFQI